MTGVDSEMLTVCLGRGLQHYAPWIPSVVTCSAFQRGSFFLHCCAGDSMLLSCESHMHIGIINKEHADFCFSLDMASLDSSLAHLLCGQAVTLLFHKGHYECMLE